MKNKTLIISASFVAICLVVFIFSTQKYNLKDSTKINNDGSITFQPEAQMLSQAIDAENASISDRSMRVSLKDEPITSKNSTTTYSYIKSVCEPDKSFKCFSSFYDGLVRNYGASVATNDIKKRGSENSSVLTVCHPLMHTIGRVASESYKSAGEAFLYGDSYCWSGYFHGVLEGIIDRVGAKNLPNELNNICADIPGKTTYNFDYYNCVHGLGHGIMAENEDEVFLSLKMCDILNGYWEQESCYGGVFMQNIIDNTNVANSGNTVKYLKSSEPLYPCTEVETRYKGQCYLGQTSYALQVTGYNYQKVFDMCATVESPFRDICNQSMGRDIANQMGHEAQRTRDKCSIPKDQNDINNCIIGATKEIVSYYHNDKEALYFCSILDENTRDMCVSTTNSYFSLFK